jgi:peroxiredoxin Q/BCP
MLKLFFCLLCFFASWAFAAQWEYVIAPDFQLNDQHNKGHNLAEFKGRWLVLYFYPKDKTSGCTIEARNFARDYSKFRQGGVDVVGVSLDDVSSHKEFATTSGLTFPLLADVDKKMSKAYDVLGLGGLYSKRQTFVINPEGVIVKHYADVDPEQHSSQLLRDLVALKAAPR